MMSKYRAWDTRLKQMGIVRKISFTAEGEIDGIEVFGRVFWLSQLMAHDLNTLILMQSTGLKDKNGMEIFEGDILSFGEWTDGAGLCLHKVIWREGRFVTYEAREDLTTTGIHPGSEIIGNIHQHPELLGEIK